MRRRSMREKLAFCMAFARAAHACTKRDAQAYLEQFHQPRTTCATARRSATKPLSATFSRQQQFCKLIGRGGCRIARASHQWYRDDQPCKGQQQQRLLRAAVCSSASSTAPSSERLGAVQRKTWPRPTSVSVTFVTESKNVGCCWIVLDPAFDAESDGDI